MNKTRENKTSIRGGLEYRVTQFLFVGAYVYLILPIIIFLLFWPKRIIGVPAALFVLLGLFLVLRSHNYDDMKISIKNVSMIKCAAIFLIVVLWVILSGIGNYTWQNADHYTRNEIFNVLVQNSWPVYSNLSDRTPFVYYLGYWLPAAVVGKSFGLSAGYFFQALWAIIGILLCYVLICFKRKKVSLWPLMIFVFFSGLDFVGTTLNQLEMPKVFGDIHMEWWSVYFQFSSMTTQLFWVFNQALPAWVACLLVFLYEKPKNMVFTCSTLLLSSSFPFVGLIPFAVFFMVKRSCWKDKYRHAHNLLVDMWKNWASIQNIFVSLVFGSIVGLYIISNDSLTGTVSLFFSDDGKLRFGILLLICIILVSIFFCVTELALHQCGKYMCVIGAFLLIVCIGRQIATFDTQFWWTPSFVWLNLTIFYFLEAGIFLLVLYPFVQDKGLFWLNAVCLYVIPLIRVGYSYDFCMRASIPGLFLIMLWCMEVFDGLKPANTIKTKTLVGLLTVFLAFGSITCIHEIKRSYIYTYYYYEPQTISEEEMYSVPNVCGDNESFFWKYIKRR